MQRKLGTLSALRLLVTLVLGISLSGFPSLAPALLSADRQESGSPANGTFYGVVFPKGAKPGDEVTASVTTDPDKYKDIPELEVILFPVPQELQQQKKDTGEGTQVVGELTGIAVDLGDGPQPANKPLTHKVPWGAASTAISVLLTNLPQRPIGQGQVPVITADNPPRQMITDGPPPPTDYSMPQLTTPGHVTVIHGPSTGNAKNMSVTFNDQPAKIVAALPGTSFIDAPVALKTLGNETPPTKVVFVGGPGMAPVEMSTGVAELRMSAGRALVTGETEEMTVTASISGVTNWSYDVPSTAMVNQDLIKKVKGLKEPRRNEGGTIMVIVKNQTHDVLEMQDFVWAIHQQDLVNGVATKQVRIRAKRRGSFRIDGQLIPYLPQTKGRLASMVSRNAGAPPVSGPPDDRDVTGKSVR